MSPAFSPDPLRQPVFGAKSVVGCILAGGRSSRMGGGDKGLLAIAGIAMIARAAERLGSRLDCVILNANGDPARFAHLGLDVVSDDPPDDAGPLAGVLAAMDWAAAHRPEATAVLTVAADTPFFPDTLVDGLTAAAGGAGPVIAASGGGRHPTFGLWPLKLREDLRRFLHEERLRKVMLFVERAGGRALAFADRRCGAGRVDPFFNVNTPEDLAEAERIAAELDRPIRRTAGGAVVVAVVGWKNAGKTTLVTRLVAEATRRGLSVATVKHAHHAADVDRPGTDSHRHREAGARQTAIVSPARAAVMREFANPADEPELLDVLDRLEPCDLVVVEGWKCAAIPKIEVRRAAAPGRTLHPDDPHVVLIAADHPVPGAAVPVLNLDDASGIVDHVLHQLAEDSDRSR